MIASPWPCWSRLRYPRLSSHSVVWSSRPSCFLGADDGAAQGRSLLGLPDVWSLQAARSQRNETDDHRRAEVLTGSCSAKLALRRGNRHGLDTNMFSALSRQSQLAKKMRKEAARLRLTDCCEAQIEIISKRGGRRPSNHSRESGYSAASKSHPSTNSVQTPCDTRVADR